MNIKMIFTFLTGALVGSSASYLYLKKRYDKAVSDEVDKFKKEYSPVETKIEDSEEKSQENSKDEQSIAKEAISKPELISKSTSDEDVFIDYKKFSTLERVIIPEQPQDTPYEINFDDYGEFDDYENICLYFYADGVVADENDEIVEKFQELVGDFWMDDFKSENRDEIYIRNDKYKADYELLRSAKSYEEDVLLNYPE